MKTLKIKSIFSTILCVIWISGLSAQSLTVTGTVTDENDQPLIGANVSIEKSRKGTVTNEHGKYSIEAMQGDIIRFSYIGYKTQKVKANRKIIDVKLYPDNNLLMEECVITSDEVSNRQSVVNKWRSEVSVCRRLSTIDMQTGKSTAIMPKTDSNLPSKIPYRHSLSMWMLLRTAI